MKLEDQVVSLELAKKLKELGVKQESLFVWVTDTRKRNPHTVKLEGSASTIIMSNYVSKIPAYTVAELGDVLPREIRYQTSTEEVSGYNGYRSMTFESGKTIIDSGWYCMYSDPHPANKVPVYSAHAVTEADARAKMLIYLIENKLITI